MRRKYPVTMIFIHWLTVVLLAINFLIGKNLEYLDFDAENFKYYRLHALTGAVIFFITVWRLILLKRNKDQLPVLEFYGKFHELSYKVVHALIYLMLLLVPVVGFITIFKSGAYVVDLGKPFPEGAKLNHDLVEIHELLVGFLIILILVHVAGVIIYRFKKDPDILKRMSFLP